MSASLGQWPLGELSRLYNYTSDFINIRLLQKLPCFYFDKVNNVGDSLNAFLLQQVSGKKVYIVKTKRFSHILPVGSILHFSSVSSCVWGSGLISPDKPRKVTFSKVLALRGFLTLSVLSKQTGTSLDVPLGDPALLMPRFYQPVPGTKRYRIGIVPHYMDQDSEMLDAFRQRSDTKIISVQQNYDSFINELAVCDYILSSSLHGLILADAYGIPNKWISLSDKLIGGEFKFKDYYSTTDISEETCNYLKSSSDLLTLTEAVSSEASKKIYMGELGKLEQVLMKHISSSEQ